MICSLIKRDVGIMASIFEVIGVGCTYVLYKKKVELTILRNLDVPDESV